MEDLTRASNLVAGIDKVLSTSSLQGCERLSRCISEIEPLLEKLQTMRCPWGTTTVRALGQLLEALERVKIAVQKYGQESPSCRENDCEFVGALRRLWQRQIEMNLAVQFQNVLDEDVDKSAWGIWGEQKLQQLSAPSLVTEKSGIESALAHH